MAYDDFFKLLQTLNELTGVDRLVRELEPNRRLFDAGTAGIARQLEEHRRLTDSMGSDLTRTVDEASRMTAGVGAQLGRHMEGWRRIQENVLGDLPSLAAQYENVLDPIAREVAANLGRSRELMVPRLTELAVVEATLAETTRNLGEPYRATRDALQAVEGWTTALEAKVAAGTEVLSHFELVSFGTIVPSLGFIADSFERTVVDLTSFADFSQTFAAEVLNQLGVMAGAPDAAASEAAIQRLAELIEAKSERVPKKWLTREGFVQLLTAILLFGFAYLKDLRQEDRFQAALRGTEERVVTALKTQVGVEERAVQRYVVTKAVRLRKAPTTESEVLCVLRPNMAVEVVRTEGNWLRVEYFDYVDAELKEGWVFKRYLQDLS